MHAGFRTTCIPALLLTLLCYGLTAHADEKLMSLVKEGKYKEAIQYADTKLPAASRDVETWVAVGSAHEKLGAKDKAWKCYEGAQKANPSDANVYLAFGRFQQSQNKCTAALENFQKSYILNRTAAAAEGIAVCAAKLKQWEKARDAAESAINLDANVFDSRRILADIYLTKKNYAAAAKQLEEITKQKAQDVKYWKQLATCHDQTGQKDELARADLRIVKLDKKDIPSRRRLAAYSLAKKDTTNAFGLLKELAVLTSKDAKVFKLLYQISANRDNAKDAILYLKNFLVLDSTVAVSHKALGDLLYVQKDLDGALGSYRTALRLDKSLKGFYKRYETIVLQKGLEKETVRVIKGAIAAKEADAASYIALGNILKKRKDYGEAIKMYKEALNTDTKNIPVLTSLGECQARSGDIAGAIVTYEQVVLMNSKAAAEYKTLGDLQAKSNKTKASMTTYKRYLERKPDDQKVAREVGLYEFKNKQYTGAIRFLTMVKNVKLHSVTYLAALGESYYQTKDYTNAALHLENARKAKPSGPVQQTILKLLGQSYEKTNQDAKAAEAYEAYTSLPGVRDSDAAYMKALLREKSDLKSAVASYQANTKVYPKDYRNFLRLGIIYSEDKASLAKSAGMLTFASNLVDTLPKVWLTLGRVQGALKKTDLELHAFQKLLKLDPQNLESNKRVGTILLKKGQVAKAITHLESASTMAPKDVEIMLLLAQGYNKTKRPKQSADLLTKAKQLKPEDVAIRLSLVETRKTAGQTKQMEVERDELAELDQKIVAKDKKDIKSRERLAQYYLDRKDNDKALNLHKELAVLTPKKAYVFKNLYLLASQKDKKKDAVLYLKNYLLLDSSDAKYHKALGDLLYEQKDLDGALEAYRKALRTNPKIKGLYKRYETIVLKKGLEKEAISVITGSIAAGEADAASYVALGDLYRKGDKYTSAIKMYKEALKSDAKNVKIMTSLAECQAKAGDANGAIITYEQVVLMNPKAVKEFKDLGNLQTKVGKKSAAIASYKKYLAKDKSDSKTARTIGLFEFEKKNYTEAVKFLGMVADAGLKNVQYLSALGQSHFHTGDFGKAAKILADLQTKKPPTSVAKSTLKLLAEAYRKIGSDLKAAQAYDSYVKIKGVVDSEASYLRAFLREKSEKAKAVTIYEYNTKRFTKDYRNFLRIGIIHAQSKATLGQAATALSKASVLIDTLPILWKTMGEVYGKLGNETRELAAYRKLLKYQPQDLEANKRVGSILMKKGQTKLAIANLESALTMSPKDPGTMLLLSDGYMKTNRPQQAAELLAKAKTINTNDPKIRLQLYELYKQLGKKDKAENEIKDLIALTKDNKHRLTYAGDLIGQKRWDDALKVVKAINASAPSDVDGLMLLAKVHRGQGKHGDAVETYKAIGFIKDKHVPALFERAETYAEMGQKDRAKEYYKKVLKLQPKHAKAKAGLAKASAK